MSADPRDVAGIFGEVSVRDDRLFAGYSGGGEVALRRSLATVAHAYGWLVQEEVVVPGWGRIDLVLREDVYARPRLIELKLDLTKPAAIRRAFQQADGYGRWWAQHHREAAEVTLAAAHVDGDLVAPIASAYPEVGCNTASYLMAALKVWDDPRLRAHRVLARLRDVRDLAEVYQHAQLELDALLYPQPEPEPQHPPT